MLLCTLATEMEAKGFLKEPELQVLVDYLGKCVNYELGVEGTLWTAKRRAMVIRKLEKIATSDWLCIDRLVGMGILPLLRKALDDPKATQDELRAAVTCLYTLASSTDTKEGLKNIFKDAVLVNCTRWFYF